MTVTLYEPSSIDIDETGRLAQLSDLSKNIASTTSTCGSHSDALIIFMPSLQDLYRFCWSKSIFLHKR